MVIEGLRQQAQATNQPFRNTRIHFRQITVQSPITIAESSPGIETLVQIRPCLYSGKGSSATWKEFRIFSFLGTESTEHCRGLVALVPDDSMQLENVSRPTLADTDPQAKIDLAAQAWSMLETRNFYRRLSRVGLDYSGPFASMRRVLARHLQARCTIGIPDTSSNMPSMHQKSHVIHPSTLDSFFQTTFPALHRANKLSTTYVVTAIEDLQLSSNIVSEPNSELSVETKVSEYGAPYVSADIVVENPGEQGGGIVLQAKGVAYTSLNYEDSECAQSQGPSPFHQVVWRLDPHLSNAEATLDHCRVATSTCTGNRRHAFDQYCQELIHETLAGLSPEEEGRVDGDRLRLLNWMRSNNSGSSLQSGNEDVDGIIASSVQGEMLRRLRTHLPGILRGDADGLSVLFQDDLVDRFYLDDVALSQCHSQLVKYIKLMKFKLPGMRILEIGAGTGGTTLPLAEALFDDTSIQQGAKYFFTDISTSYFQRARSKLGRFKGSFEYRRLDIELPPEQQGFELGSFDLIVASNVLHATQKMEQTLTHVRSLLKQNGKLALVEITAPSLRFGFWGCLPGWFRGINDDRDLAPLLSAAGWDKVLKNAGFSGADLEMKDYESDEHEFSLIISDVEPKEEIDPRGKVHLILPDKDQEMPCSLSRMIQSVQSPQVMSVANLSSTHKPGGTFIFLLELEKPFLLDPSPEEWRKFQDIINHADAVIWVTRGAMIKCAKPSQGLISGLARSLRSEDYKMKFITLDLDPDVGSTPQTAEMVWRVYEHTIGRKAPDGPLMMEWELAIRGNNILVPRLVRDQEVMAYVENTVSTYHPQLEAEVEPGRAICLAIGSPGLLDTLYWKDAPSNSERLGTNQVRVEMQYAALNFKDLMLAMGQISGTPALLFEGS
ncbi:hypothetical protein FQN49_008511, partial [Arthroderma sp. PD_2]